MQCVDAEESGEVDLKKTEQMTQVLCVSPHQLELNAFAALRMEWFSIGSLRLLRRPGELNKTTKQLPYGLTVPALGVNSLERPNYGHFHI